MDEDDQQDLEDKLPQDVLPQVEGTVNHNQNELGHQHDQERNRNLARERITNIAPLLMLFDWVFDQFNRQWNFAEDNLIFFCIDSIYIYI